jgi:hypothetical protein
MTKEDVLALISQCAEKLGHAPNLTELTEAGNVKRQHIRKLFGSYKRALLACNLERGGPGHQLTMEELFLDWARVVRNMNKLPSLAEYELMSKYSQGPLTRRYRSWMRVPHGLKQFAEKQGLAEEWKDVMEISFQLDFTGRGKGQDFGVHLRECNSVKGALEYAGLWTAGSISWFSAWSGKRDGSGVPFWHAGGAAWLCGAQGTNGVSGLRGDAEYRR